ncbi:MAG: helix-turn-helix transcriptional regulator [Chitinophagales bacterium]|nr:helix-turn-helix transcriptional regulator [Chitinophagales bacterium]
MKKQAFLEEYVQIANYATVLAHPARVMILQFLKEYGACMVSDLQQHIPLAQSTISQHIKILNNAGLLKSKSEANKTYYELKNKTIKNLRTILNQYTKQLTK